MALEFGFFDRDIGAVETNFLRGLFNLDVNLQRSIESKFRQVGAKPVENGRCEFSSWRRKMIR